MGLVARRAATARGLLLAASGAVLVCAVLLAGGVVHARAVLRDGVTAAVDAARAQERSVLLRGPLQAETFPVRDAAVRARTTPRFGGVQTEVRVAGYATARQLAGGTGTAVPGQDGRVLAAMMFLEGLEQHADLVAGQWPRSGGTPVQVTLGEAVARTLGVRVGAQIPVLDRLTERRSAVTVVGIWRPRRPADPYWRLFPQVGSGVAAGSSTYGPVVLDRADFLAGYAGLASAAWVIEPHLVGASPERLDALVDAVTDAVDNLPTQVGYQSSGVAESALGTLVQRLRRAELVGRSSLVTPVLLLVVLGGYTLLLLAALLGEQRQTETALLQARGAGRGWLTGLAAREAAVIVAPAFLLAPWLATAAVRHLYGGSGEALTTWPDRYAWAVAGLAAAAGAAAMLLPALRSGSSYVAMLANRSRPTRRAVAQRAGLDVALVIAAALGWLQLREYASPVAGRAGGGLGVDPLLAAAPTLGVLAGVAVGLRVLPPLTRIAERVADRRGLLAGTLGSWQAGRRAHAGPVLLLALAVAASTLAWCLVATAQRSVADRSAHTVGADLRVTQVVGAAVDTARVAALPGVRVVLPAVRGALQLGPAAEPATMVALDTARAETVMRLRADLTDAGVHRTFAAMAADRPPDGDLPVLSGRLTGVISVDNADGPARTAMIIESDPGDYRRVDLGVTVPGRPSSFSVDLPPGSARPRLIGFTIEAQTLGDAALNWRIAGLRTGGTPVDQSRGLRWRAHDSANLAGAITATADTLTAQYQAPQAGGVDGATEPVTFVVSPKTDAPRVPVVATDAALAALQLRVGEASRLRLGPAEVDVRITGAVRALPGTTEPAALLVDLPSWSAALFDVYGIVVRPEEWWLAAQPGQAASAASVADALPGVQLLDRREAASSADRDPFTRGPRTALWAAALGAVLLAALGLAVDARAVARRRGGELSMLRTLGAGPRLLRRALLAEQAILAVVGLVVGLVSGVAVAAGLAPLSILTPAASRPVPPALFAVPWWPIAASVALLATMTILLHLVTAVGVQRRSAAIALRNGSPE